MCLGSKMSYDWILATQLRIGHLDRDEDQKVFSHLMVHCWPYNSSFHLTVKYRTFGTKLFIEGWIFGFHQCGYNDHTWVWTLGSNRKDYHWYKPQGWLFKFHLRAEYYVHTTVLTLGSHIGMATMITPPGLVVGIGITPQNWILGSNLTSGYQDHATE